MTNAALERKYFWELFQNYLKQKGSPFEATVRYVKGEPHQSATVAYGNGAIITVDFLAAKGILRASLYIDDNLALYEKIKSKQQTLEDILGFSIECTEGVKNNMAKWVKKEWDFTPYQRYEYEDLLNKSFPLLERFIDVFSEIINY